MPSFSIPLSGLTASSSALSTIANNLANLNTIGYKDQQVRFSDLFYQTVGSTGAGDAVQQGAGTMIGSIPSLFTQGNVNPTGVATDVAIMNGGFFIVEKDGLRSYTRAGNFEVGKDNLLETSSTPITIYDSLGASHNLKFTFTKTDTNAWDYSVSIPAADVGGTTDPTVL